MEPIRVEALLAGAVCLPNGPIALDSLLAAAVAIRDGLPPPASALDCSPIEIPIAREAGGRFHLASLSLCDVEANEGDFTNRRFPLSESQDLAGSKLRRIDISAGACKSYRIPRTRTHLRDDRMQWFCVGDAVEILALLAWVPYVGKRRAVGLGRVREWRVERCAPWEGFPVIDEDGWPLRPLPPDFPGAREDAERAIVTLTYPYWNNLARRECKVPSWAQ